jgi:hypothetical protein
MRKNIREFWIKYTTCISGAGQLIGERAESIVEWAGVIAGYRADRALARHKAHTDRQAGTIVKKDLVDRFCLLNDCLRSAFPAGNSFAWLNNDL